MYLPPGSLESNGFIFYIVKCVYSVWQNKYTLDFVLGRFFVIRTENFVCDMTNHLWNS